MLPSFHCFLQSYFSFFLRWAIRYNENDKNTIRFLLQMCIFSAYHTVSYLHLQPDRTAEVAYHIFSAFAMFFGCTHAAHNWMPKFNIMQIFCICAETPHKWNNSSFPKNMENHVFGFFMKNIVFYIYLGIVKYTYTV